METLGKIYEFGKKLWEATGEWIGYVYNLDANMQSLKRKIEDLSNHEEDVNTDLSIAEQIHGKRRKKVVEAWLKEVQTIRSDVQSLDQKVIEERNHVFSRPWLGKGIVKKIQEVEELQQKGGFPNGLAIDQPPTSGRFIPTGSFLGETTCIRNKEEVWAHLMNDEVRRIGLYGMGGAGKTTIMHHINNELLQETSSFDNVIWVTVSKAFNILKVQDEIAKALNLHLSNHDNGTIRACELYRILFVRKRYVLILDDLWDAFPLEKVGIPEPTSSNGCKLVLTTRRLEVSRKMGCTAVKVELLTEQEALDLFMSKAVEQETMLAPELKEIARQVAEECGRLPLAVVTVAGSMKGRDTNDICEWRNVLNELTHSTKQMRDGEIDVLEVLKFSYSRLKDEKLQKCFLYCALYPEDHVIPRIELVKYWIAEGLITEMNKREAMFDEGHAVLNKLVNTCLLESCTRLDTEECVKMHDLIRDMALKIKETSPRFMVHAGERLERVPFEDWSEDLERVSLIHNEIKILSFTAPPNCPRLTTLLLNYNPLSVIPDSFFMHMPCLTLLDLSHSHIKFLPDSISNLKSLHGLFLRHCANLEYVPSLEKLKVLKELKMWGCDIKDAPQGIEELFNLRYLDLMWNRNLQTFPSLKLSNLCQLQFLRIDYTKTTVAAEDLLWLRHLKVVGAHFKNVQEFLSYVKSEQFQNLEDYYLSVGIFSPTYEPQFTTGKEVFFWESLFGRLDTLMLPNNIKLLWINECDCHVLKSLSDIPSLRDATDLIYCHLYRCGGLESIISCSFSEDCWIPLKSVEMLELHELPNLRVLFDGGVIPPQRISFNLKRLTLEKCPRIKNVFPVAKLLQNFPNLEELYVSQCDDVEDIIGGGEEEVTEMSDSGGHNCQNDSNSIIVHPNLKSIDLDFLPKLKSMYKGKMLCKSLESIEVFDCPMLRRLPNFSVHVDSEQASSSAISPPPPPPPVLRCIEGEREWWESLIWEDPQYKSTLEPLFHHLEYF